MSAHRRTRRLPIAITVALLAVFLALAAGCRVLYDQTEDRLLKQRVGEAGVALQLTVSGLRAPLDAAAKLARATDGDPEAFAAIIEPSVGAEKSFTSAALYRIGDTTPIAQVGTPSTLPADGPNSATAMLDAATKDPFVLVDLLSGGPQRRLGYAVADGDTTPTFVVYGERVLSADPYVRRRTDQPFAQVNYAMYLGTQPVGDQLLAASLRDLPIEGRQSSLPVPFGDKQLLLVMTPTGHLSGDLFANLWWMVGGLGVVASSAFGLLANRLLERRDTALSLAADNERLYDEQRHIAETLQLSLLPEHLMTPSGLAVAARYWPAGSANLIGGDFYDLFQVDEARWGVAIGDVCGKGIEAAALTGLARHTLRAAARHNSDPTEVLQAVHHALQDHQPPTFCTACFGYIWRGDDDTFHLQLSLGGHPAPLLRHADGTVEPIGIRGTLLGMIEPSLSIADITLHQGDTVVFYTDGLTDAPPEQAVSVEELTALIEQRGDEPIEQLADSIRAIKRHRRPLGSSDDTAVLILRLPEPGSTLDAAADLTSVAVSAAGTEL